jgi:hypothetical protein
MTVSEKQTNAKRTGSMAQVVECLPIKSKAHNFNSLHYQKIKNKKKTTETWLPQLLQYDLCRGLLISSKHFKLVFVNT